MPQLTQAERDTLDTHTPGPWSFHLMSNPKPRSCELGDREWFYADYSIGAGNKIIAEVQYQTNAAGWEKVDRISEFTANAHLIAAAPELLDVAQRILDRGYVSKHIGEEHDDHMALVAAIAKARGEAQ